MIHSVIHGSTLRGYITLCLFKLHCRFKNKLYEWNVCRNLRSSIWSDAENANSKCQTHINTRNWTHTHIMAGNHGVCVRTKGQVNFQGVFSTCDRTRTCGELHADTSSWPRRLCWQVGRHSSEDGRSMKSSSWTGQTLSREKQAAALCYT